ncbi:MAG: hypothetical protein JWM33_2492 [Caulobacteraceae bacterium]|nr:hypothetical protein [Caulobacteraceae bacterium]
MRKPFALVALALLVACSRPAVEPPQAAALSSPGSITVGESGVGPLTAQIPFEARSLEALFPGSHAQATVMTDGDRQYPILTVLGPDLNLILEVDGGDGARITSVEVLGGKVQGPGGETVMSPWLALGFKPADCVPGKGRDLAALVCHRPGAPRLAYIVGIRKWSGPGAPSAEKLTTDAFLRELRWTPPK